MTFEERVAALAPLGFTPRQTRFLVTAALHSGYCLRRQYLAFAGIRYGKNVREFLDTLVRRELARRFQYQPNRGHVYHLHATPLYRVLGQRDNRNRRHVSPAAIARKLMALNYVLSVPDAEWFGTEEDKVTFFTGECGLRSDDLPRRAYVPGTAAGKPAIRYFVEKQPIYRVPGQPGVHFVYVVQDHSGAGFEQFLHAHARLFTGLAAWSVVAVCPHGGPGLTPYRRVFDGFVASTSQPILSGNEAEIRWFFQTRQVVETGDLRTLSMRDLDRYRAVRGRLTSPQIEALYGRWLAGGTDVRSLGIELTPHRAMTGGRLVLHELPSRYSQFGPLPGVC